MNNSISRTFFFLYLLTFQYGFTQTAFQKTYGGANDEQAFSVTQTTDKGFVIAGYTNSYGAGANDFYIFKTDTAGNLIWSKTYGRTNYDQAYSIQQTIDGGFIIAGYSKSPTAANYDAYLIKTDMNGDTLWTRTYGGPNNDYANSVQQTADGGYILAGYTTSFVSSPDSGNIYLIKTDASGNLSWSKSLGGINNISDGYSVKQTTDKGYVVTGYTNGFGEPNGDTFLFKTDSSGNVSWTKTYGSTGIDWGNSVQQTNDGGYIIAGSSSFDSTNLLDIYLIKTNSNGDTLWTRTYGGLGYDFGQAIEQTNDGGYIITGYTNTCDTCNYNVCLIKTDANGNLSWSNINGGKGDDEGNCVYQTHDGGYIVAGLTNTYSDGNYDVYLIKTDANGNSCNQANYNCVKKHPSTIEHNQTMQLYAAGTIASKISPAINTGNIAIDVCYPIGIKQVHETQTSIQVFPNPNNGIFTIQLNNRNQEVNLSVENSLGEVMWNNKVNSPSYTINLSSLANGTYFIHARSYTEMISHKIIVIK